MADGLNYATRAGDGQAGVLSDGGLLNMYGALLQKQQLRKQQEQQALATELAQVKPDGLRNDADRGVFYNKYNDVKNLAAKIPYEKDGWSKAQLKAQVDKGLLELNDYAVRSKQQGTNESEWSKAYMANPEHWGDDALKHVQASKQAALDDDGVVKDFTAIQRVPNVDKIHKDLSGIVKANLESQVWADNRLKGREGNKTGTFVQSSRTVDPEGLYHAVANYYDVNPDFKRHLQLTHPELYQDSDPTTAKANAIKNYVDNAVQSQMLGATKESKPKKFDPDWQPDKFYEHAAYSAAHKTTGNGKAQDPTYFQDLSERIRGGDDDARQEFGKLFENHPAFLNGVHFDVRDPKAVKVTIPAKYSTDVSKIAQDANGKNIPNSERKLVQNAHTYTLDSTNPVAWTTALSQIYSNSTGEKTAIPSKSLTPYGKGKVPGGQQVTTASPNTDLVTVTVNGRTGQIPKKNLSSFLKQYPGAKRL
jgi:hypothetical protein